MVDSTQDMTWWLEMVKIARKCFEVLSKGEEQATAWRPKNLARVKKEVLAFSWGTNQAKDGHIDVKNQIYNEVFDGSDLIHLGLFKFDEWNQVTYSRWLCSSDKDQSWHVGTLIWWSLEYTASVERNQLKRFNFVILLKLS